MEIDERHSPVLNSIHGNPPEDGEYVVEVDTHFSGQIFAELELIVSVQGNPMKLFRFRIESFSFSALVNTSLFEIIQQ